MDEDCDVEVLSPSDFETDTNEDLAYSFEPTRPEHITYVIKMVEIAKLRALTTPLSSYSSTNQ
jgi:hypothetical protein